MSNSMDFEVPPPHTMVTDDILIKLDKNAIELWVKGYSYWTLDQACALLRGFLPLDNWEPDYEAKSKAIKPHISQLQSQLAIAATKKAQPLSEYMEPREWLEAALKCGKVFEPIEQAINGKPIKVRESTFDEIRVYAHERATDIALRMLRLKKKPTKIAIAEELFKDKNIKGKRGNQYEKADNIRREFLNDWKLPDNANTD